MLYNLYFVHDSIFTILIRLFVYLVRHYFHTFHLKVKMLKASRRLFRPAPWQNDTLLEIGTRDIFTEEHDLCREQFRRFWRSVDRSRVTSWEQQEYGLIF